MAKADQLAFGGADGGFCILHARKRHVLLIGSFVEQTSSEVARSLWVDGRTRSRLVLRRTGAAEHSTSANMSTRRKVSAAEERCRDIPFFARPNRVQMIPAGQAGEGHLWYVNPSPGLPGQRI